jgi:hypothetical protein
LNSSNTNQLKNVVFTQLSKEYNIQPMIQTMNQKFGQIMSYISEKITIDPKLSFDQNMNRLKSVLVEKATQGFRSILTPYAHVAQKNIVNDQPGRLNDQPGRLNDQPGRLNDQPGRIIEPEMPDVNDLYSRLLNERDYSSSNISKPVIIDPPQSSNTQLYEKPYAIKNESAILQNFSQPYLPLEPIREEPIDRNLMFEKKLNNLKNNRTVTIQQERNLIDLETIASNFNTNILGIEKKIENNNSNDLTQNNVVYDDKFSVKNVGTNIVEHKEIKEHRYAEYKEATEMKYQNIDRTFFLNNKDRKWYGEISNGELNPGLELQRYRIVLNNSNTDGIFLQNRHKNITGFRVLTVHISCNDNDYVPPYIFVQIPEIENRIETSLTNNKMVFCVLMRDTITGNQIKYINYFAGNTYLQNPLSELNNITFNILNPMGELYNNNLDNLTIGNIYLDDIVIPEYIILETEKYFTVSQYNIGDLINIKRFGFKNGTNSKVTEYINRPDGHIYKTPLSETNGNSVFNKIYIKVLQNQQNDGSYQLDQSITDLKNYINNGGNQVGKVYGTLINVNLQPSIIFEITKIEPLSSKMNMQNSQVI